MEIAELSTAIVTRLAPFLPLLVSAARFSRDAIAEMIVQNGGQAAFNHAQGLWQRIRGSYEDDALVNGAAMMVSAEPTNESFHQQLANILATRLSENKQLAEELLSLLGGKGTVQEIIAGKGSLIENITQEMEGSGTQSVRATNDSIITGVTQKRTK